MATGKGKRDPYKFNLRFSPDNPMEVVAANFLNRVGAKASYISQLIIKELAATGTLQMYQDMPAPEILTQRSTSRNMSVPLKQERDIRENTFTAKAEENGFAASCYPASTEPDESDQSARLDKSIRMLQQSDIPQEIGNHEDAASGYSDVARVASIMSSSLPDIFADEDDEDE